MSCRLRSKLIDPWRSDRYRIVYSSKPNPRRSGRRGRDSNPPRNVDSTTSKATDGIKIHPKQRKASNWIAKRIADSSSRRDASSLSSLGPPTFARQPRGWAHARTGTRSSTSISFLVRYRFERPSVSRNKKTRNQCLLEIGGRA